MALGYWRGIGWASMMWSEGIDTKITLQLATCNSSLNFLVATIRNVYRLFALRCWCISDLGVVEEHWNFRFLWIGCMDGEIQNLVPNLVLQLACIVHLVMKHNRVCSKECMWCISLFWSNYWSNYKWLGFCDRLRFVWHDVPFQHTIIFVYIVYICECPLLILFFDCFCFCVCVWVWYFLVSIACPMPAQCDPPSVNLHLV